MNHYLFAIVFCFLSTFPSGSDRQKPGDLVEITTAKDGILLDIRYATTDNFTRQQLYDCPRCFLRKEVAAALRNAQRNLKKQGFGLQVFDCYRPHSIQKKMWKIVPDPHYVANPKKGSMHNRGQAVDLTLVDSSGCPLDMGTGYDFFGQAAHWAYQGLPPEIKRHRQLLLQAMENAGFHHIRTEWWHFSIKHLPQSKIYSWEWKCVY